MRLQVTSIIGGSKFTVSFTMLLKSEYVIELAEPALFKTDLLLIRGG